MPEKVQYPEIWCGWQMSRELRMLSVGALELGKSVGRVGANGTEWVGCGPELRAVGGRASHTQIFEGFEDLCRSLGGPGWPGPAQDLCSEADSLSSGQPRALSSCRGPSFQPAQWP